MPDDNTPGNPLPDPEPSEHLDSFAVYEAARRMRAETLRQMFARLFTRRSGRRAGPTAGAVDAAASDASRATDGAGAEDRREAA